MSGPIDTIRELACETRKRWLTADELNAILAALTEVEQQLAAHKPWLEDELDECDQRAGRAEARAVAAETALAETAQAFDDQAAFGAKQMERADAAERRANDLREALEAVSAVANEREARIDELADALRWIAHEGGQQGCGYREAEEVARAALDRHTHQDKAVT